METKNQTYLDRKLIKNFLLMLNHKNFLFLWRGCCIFCFVECCYVIWCTVQKMKFSIKVFVSKCDQIWSYLLKQFLMESFIFCAVVNLLVWLWWRVIFQFLTDAYFSPIFLRKLFYILVCYVITQITSTNIIEPEL